MGVTKHELFLFVPYVDQHIDKFAQCTL